MPITVHADIMNRNETLDTRTRVRVDIVESYWLDVSSNTPREEILRNIEQHLIHNVVDEVRDRLLQDPVINMHRGIRQPELYTIPVGRGMYAPAPGGIYRYDSSNSRVHPEPLTKKKKLTTNIRVLRSAMKG